ncbi:MAG: zinc ribbon domain-containing protein, partial [Candidatus Micrarchaeia archaeon]
MKVIKVDPKDTTQECSRCGHVKRGSERLSLSERIYHCNVCGLTMDRDENSSKVILKRAKLLEKVSSKATLGQRESYAQGKNVRFQKEAFLEELRTDNASFAYE